MPDWIYDALEAFQAFMDQGSILEAVSCMLLGAVGGPGLVFLHELGHALTARARGLAVHTLVVGDTPDLLVRAGRIRMQLGRSRDPDGVPGYVEYAGDRATPTDVMLIAAAGPAASAVGALAVGLVAAAPSTDGMLGVFLWILAAQSALLAIGNLVPFGDPIEGDASDGRWIEFAFEHRHALRAPDDWIDPNAATSVAPPSRELSGGSAERAAS